MDGERIRTVIVDDDSEGRELLRAQLERTGRFEIVGEAATAGEAIALAELTPDLVILDEHLGEENGVDHIPDVLSQAPDAVIIVYTATSGTGTRKRAADFGAKAVVGKTDSPEMLLGAVDRLFGAPRSRQAGPARVVADGEGFASDMQALLHADAQKRSRRRVRDHGVRPMVIGALIALPLLAVAVWIVAALLGLTR